MWLKRQSACRNEAAQFNEPAASNSAINVITIAQKVTVEARKCKGQSSKYSYPIFSTTLSAASVRGSAICVSSMIATNDLKKHHDGVYRYAVCVCASSKK